MYRWIVFLHLAAIFGFLLLHGSSMSVAFSLRRERRPERIRALLDLSSGLLTASYVALLVLMAAGIADGFLGHWWDRGWIWLGLGLLVAMVALMWRLASGYTHQVRKAVGLPYMEGWKSRDAVEPASLEALDGLLGRGRPWLLAAIGYGGAAVLALLMRFRPF